MARKKGRPPSVSRKEYKDWLKEAKHLEGGKITLAKPAGADAGNWFPARRFGSEVLPEEEYRELCLYGYSNKAGSFKLKAVHNHELADFLLMGHIDHHGAPLVVDEQDFGDHPHFHEWDWLDGSGRPDNVQRVPETIRNQPDITPEDFLGAFSDHYVFRTHDDGFEVEIDNEAPPEPRASQTPLSIFNNG